MAPKKRSGRRRKAKSVDLTVYKAFLLFYTKNLVFTKWYDNNGVDEQGIYTLLTLQQMLPSSSSAMGNDYNRAANLKGITVQIRWPEKSANLPVAAQIFINDRGAFDIKHSFPSTKALLKGSRYVALHCRMPPFIAIHPIPNPSDEKNVSIIVAFYGMDLTSADIPPFEITTTLKGFPAPFIARSGK